MGKKHIERRAKVLEFLGGQCVVCGFSDTRALQIDHINGGGNKERRESPSCFSYWKKIMSTPSGKYQLLCANCNWIKRASNEESNGLFRRLPNP